MSHTHTHLKQQVLRDLLPSTGKNFQNAFHVLESSGKVGNTRKGTRRAPESFAIFAYQKISARGTGKGAQRNRSACSNSSIVCAIRVISLASLTKHSAGHQST